MAARDPCVIQLTPPGSPAIRANVLEAALLSLPALSQLRLWEVRLQPLSGLDKAVCSLLTAAWGSGRRLEVLEARRCPLLSQRMVSV